MLRLWMIAIVILLLFLICVSLVKAGVISNSTIFNYSANDFVLIN